MRQTMFFILLSNEKEKKISMRSPRSIKVIPFQERTEMAKCFFSLFVHLLEISGSKDVKLDISGILIKDPAHKFK